MLIPKTKFIRDREYLDHLRTQPCTFTCLSGSDSDAVDPMHIGTAGKGIKSSDDEAIPCLHSLHQKAHQVGEMSIIRKIMPNWLLREALRAWAREEYKKWKEEQ